VDAYPLSQDNIKEIRALGLENWSAKQQEMVDQGFRYSDYRKKKEPSR
jgi:hypothetical protein